MQSRVEGLAMTGFRCCHEVDMAIFEFEWVVETAPSHVLPSVVQIAAVKPTAYLDQN
jgi:hypothetical protein